MLQCFSHLATHTHMMRHNPRAHTVFHMLF